MGSMPCCDKMGLKKGPWTPEEDQILISHIHRYGHGNWRALPRKAGLLRCGKSCRLRWTNYLRPDVKRGDFSKEEEETIICLHGILGNRWSAIAAKLPGRTDNEIKNVWHTHLKKRLNPEQPIKESKRRNRSNAKRRMAQAHESPACSRSDASSSLGTTRNSEVGIEESRADSLKWLPDIDRTLRCSGESTANRGCAVVEQQGSSKDEDVVSFWINLLAEVGNSS